MGGMSLWHWIIVIAVVLLLFGRGKISELMGDVAQGIKSFKKGMAEDEDKKEPPKQDPKTIDHQPAPPVAPQAESRPETKPADRQPEAAASQNDQRKVG
jgi:sec-independent protein translocase protein TatA